MPQTGSLEAMRYVLISLLLCIFSRYQGYRNLIPRKTAEILYKSLSRPILEYGDMIFDNTTQEM